MCIRDSNKNDVDVMRSASGGAADSAAKTMLQMGGVVYGAASVSYTHLPKNPMS